MRQNKTECKFSRESSSSGREHYRSKQFACCQLCSSSHLGCMTWWSCVAVPPTADVGNAQITAVVGQPLTLRCSVQGHPSPLVHWLHNVRLLSCAILYMCLWMHVSFMPGNKVFCVLGLLLFCFFPSDYRYEEKCQFAGEGVMSHERRKTLGSMERKTPSDFVLPHSNLASKEELSMFPQDVDG